MSFQISNLKIDDRVVSPENIKIFGSDKHELEDERTIEEARIENDMILYFVFKKEGFILRSIWESKRLILRFTDSDAWEEIEVHNPSSGIGKGDEDKKE